MYLSVLWWPIGHSSNHFEVVLRGPFAGDVTEDVVKGAALAIKDKGLLDLGYKYINLYVRAQTQTADPLATLSAPSKHN
jgi:hypothetical protein